MVEILSEIRRSKRVLKLFDGELRLTQNALQRLLVALVSMIRNGDANFVALEPYVRPDLALLNKPEPNQGRTTR